MKKSKTFFACAMLAALASCSNDHVLSQQSPAPSDPDVINIVAASSKPVTRAANIAADMQDTQFADNELINVYLEENVPSGGGSATTTYTMLRYKVTNTNNNGGKQLALNTDYTQDAPHYPISGNGIDAYAFYPALGTGTSAYDVTKNLYSFSVAENQSAIADYRKSDLMFGTNNWDTSTGAPFTSFAGTKKPNPVNLYFKHLLSKIIVKLKPGPGLTAAQLKGATVKLYNAYPKATINPSKTDITVSVDNTTSTPPTGGYTLTTGYASTESSLNPDTYEGCAGIIIPQDIDIPSSPGVTKFIEITLSSTYGSAKYVYNIADGDGTSDNKMTFASGNQYTYTITLSAGDVVVVSTEIKNWNNNNISGNANLEPAS